MKYRKGYKYQLAEDEVIQTALRPEKDIFTKRIELTRKGQLTVREGYSWDGASGPCIDRKTNMQASCAHDALYQLMRMDRLRFKFWRQADKEYARIMREHGEWPWVIKINLKGLSAVKGKHARPDMRKKVYEA